MSDPADNLGLYLSVPFCRAKCSFCNFASGVGTAEAIDRYVAKLCEEICGARDLVHGFGGWLPEVVDTLYLGGGTPSLLTPAQMEKIFAAIRDQFQIAPGAEITMEAAPGQIDNDLLETALVLGVNRVSLGVQSFVDRETQAVGRSHSESSCLKEFARLRSAGVTNLGADLIAGLPYQTESSWHRTLEIATTSGLEHLSVYMLEVDDESRLGREVLNGGARLHAPAVASEDLVADLYEQACAVLPSMGYGHYEISNFAQQGRQSRHNRKYWERRPYLGLGLDAHSLALTEIGAVRWANWDELEAYASAKGPHESRQVSQREAFEEEVYLGLRLCEGLPRARLAPYPDTWQQELEEAAAELEQGSLLERDSHVLKLTDKGRLMSSLVFHELLQGAAA